MTISIVTAAMNRHEHLMHSARAAAKLAIHSEHIIIDFDSATPINRYDLPDDDRIKLHRVKSPDGRWWLTQAYNVGLSLARSEYILKLDADAPLTAKFADELLRQLDLSNAHLLCNRLTRPDWNLPHHFFCTSGIFLCKRTSLEAVRGFNPYLRGWGGDEEDLYSRFFLAGFPIARLPREGVRSIEHGDDQREAPFRQNRRPIQGCWITSNVSKPRNRMRAQAAKNRRIATASICKSISWPTFDDYRACFLASSSVPSLSKVSLFDQTEYEQLLTLTAQRLLNASRATDCVYRALRKAGLGPYSPSGAKQLLDDCGVDLSLVK